MYNDSSALSKPDVGEHIWKACACMCSVFNLKIGINVPNNCPEQMLYYVENLTDTIKFYHNLLKSNGRLMIIIEAGRFYFALSNVCNTMEL